MPSDDQIELWDDLGIEDFNESGNPKNGYKIKDRFLKQRKLENERQVELLYDIIKNPLNYCDGKLNPNASKFKIRHVKIMLKHMGVDGKSYKSLAFKLGVHPKTMENWEKVYPEWKAAKDIAESGRLGVIEDLLSGVAHGQIKGQSAAAIFYSKNAAPDDFKDKQEIEHSGGVTYVIDTGIPAISNEYYDEQGRLKDKPIEVEAHVIDRPQESDEDLL